ncbi:uncharacterized protein A4U43_C07F4410 [Asparagus officinalis]|uniref:Uncharacterized protein n=1 Tax=Asparagus officinalis TaxID=4686 RepID=A0A5P1E9I7_ASPOF|nr:uncharacterized protein A4U43_C07F4410 [Asparagus officinalis]
MATDFGVMKVGLLRLNLYGNDWDPFVYALPDTLITLMSSLPKRRSMSSLPKRNARRRGGRGRRGRRVWGLGLEIGEPDRVAVVAEEDREAKRRLWSSWLWGLGFGVQGDGRGERDWGF